MFSFLMPLLCEVSEYESPLYHSLSGPCSFIQYIKLQYIKTKVCFSRTLLRKNMHTKLRDPDVVFSFYTSPPFFQRGAGGFSLLTKEKPTPACRQAGFRAGVRVFRFKGHRAAPFAKSIHWKRLCEHSEAISSGSRKMLSFSPFFTAPLRSRYGRARSMEKRIEEM
jgi:hypothetical protein